MKVRRVVTATSESGRSKFESDGQPPRTVAFETLPGFMASMIWADEADRAEDALSHDITAAVASWLPPAGGS